MSNSKLQTPIQYVKGVGPKLAKIFARIGVATVEDLFYLIPRDFEDRRNIKPIVQIRPAPLEIVKGEIAKIESQATRSRFSILKIYLRDQTATIQAVWFNQPYLLKLLRRGMKIIAAGKVEFSPYDQILQLQVRDFEIDTGDNPKIMPRYPLTQGLYPKKIRSVVKTAFDNYFTCIEDDKVRQALRSLHFPGDPKEIEPARSFLAYEELFAFQLGLLLQRKKYRDESKGRLFDVNEKEISAFRAILPFRFTAAQASVLAEITADLKSGKPMNRLLQGDVGSGKTAVAAAAAFLAVRSGYQAAILAPTEILAQQHCKKFCELFNAQNFRIELLTSSTSSDEKRAQAKAADIIIGTHALLEEKVKFGKLGLVVVDEQHRFGVHQRARMAGKGFSPHLLVMTATPIPRSLALTLYGDLDRSIISQMPPGRTPVKTYYVPALRRAGANDFIREQVKAGRQAFVVCPLVEESGELDLKAAEEEASRLQKEIFPEFKVGLLHGRLKSAEKEKIMRAFAENKINLLVSTTVIEVGIDIPNATIMLVEHAERFGLSQLHQLRGRIGRGSGESYCFLVASPKSPEARARIKAMVEISDGFKIAEEDLRLRGPGEMLGARQSGLPNFRVADIIRDEPIMRQARAAAVELIEKDPNSARNRWESQRCAIKDPAAVAGIASLN